MSSALYILVYSQFVFMIRVVGLPMPTCCTTRSGYVAHAHDISLYVELYDVNVIVFVRLISNQNNILFCVIISL